jgi:ABC-type tungstate transport system permease subunit
VNRRAFIASLALSGLAFAAPGCGSDKPRALVVADGSGAIHAPGVDVRVKSFERRSGRAVRVLQVSADQAITLASRGEADVAVVPMDVSLDTFLASDHGSVAGFLPHHGERLRVLEVNAKQHPKVDAKGAKDLASALLIP